MSEPYTFGNTGLTGHDRNGRAVTFCLGAPFDSVCTHLDAEYLEAGWRNLADTLPRFGIDPLACEWGGGHPGLMITPSETWEDSPFTALGWWLPESAAEPRHHERAHPGWWLDLWAEVERVLLASDPPLYVAQHGYRSWVVRGENDAVLAVHDGTAGLAMLSAAALDELSDWRGRLDAGSGPWADAAAALWNRDQRAFDTALHRVMHGYTPAAAEIVIRGFAGYAFRWIDDDAPLGPVPAI